MYMTYIIVEKPFSISIAPVRRRGESLVAKKTLLSYTFKESFCLHSKTLVLLIVNDQCNFLGLSLEDSG
jgi:hypothetical protein